MFIDDVVFFYIGDSFNMQYNSCVYMRRKRDQPRSASMRKIYLKMPPKNRVSNEYSSFKNNKIIFTYRFRKIFFRKMFRII